PFTGAKMVRSLFFLQKKKKLFNILKADIMIEIQVLSWSLESKFTVGFQEKQKIWMMNSVYLGYGDCVFRGQIDQPIIS
ncbi:hypothetical protein DKP78_26060, partial [Enterococcus faecium]